MRYDFAALLVTKCGLRTYKTEPQIWGDNHCEHDFAGYKRPDGGGHPSGSAQVGATKADSQRIYDYTAAFCLKCGAWRGELGLEPTIELYIDHLIQIFDEVKRVLKKTGTCWVNIDDSYFGGNKGYGDTREPGTCLSNIHGDIYGEPTWLRAKKAGLKVGVPAKSLCLIPSHFALAMVNSSWILRNDICWNKSNPMPESVKDRFTGSWEHLFFFVKSNAIQYWTNPVTGQITDKQPLGTKGEFGLDWVYRKLNEEGKVRQRTSLWEGHTYFFEQQFEPHLSSPIFSREIISRGKNYGNPELSGQVRDNHDIHTCYGLEGRNKRDVWQINTEPYPEAHFATFPEKLCEIPILAGCPSHICKKCGKAREKIYKVVARQVTDGMKIAGCNKDGGYDGQDQADYASGLAQSPSDTKRRILESMSEVKEAGYTDCGCNAGFESGVVLDLFAGAGTTGAVAKRLGRKYIGIELAPAYCKLHIKRLQGIPLAMELV